MGCRAGVKPISVFLPQRGKWVGRPHSGSVQFYTGPFTPRFKFQVDQGKSKGRGSAEPEELHFPAGLGHRGACPSSRRVRSCGWLPVARGRMDHAGRWQSLPKGPSLKHLTDPSYGIPREQQKPALQELTRAHVESFNYAVREGLSHAVQVSAASSQAAVSSALCGSTCSDKARGEAKLEGGRGEGPPGLEEGGGWEDAGVARGAG